MAHLPPSAVFGALPQTSAVHVLFLIENSLPMVEHLYTLQRQLLPSVLGAIRLANPGIDVQIFWETTGKTQEQTLSQQKPQRHFDDFPHIDVVGLPRNRLSPLFIKQSVELFLFGNAARESITQHVVLVAMSDPINDPFAFDDPSTSSAPSSSEDTKWNFIANSLIQNRIILHIIANPTAKLSRLFELHRKTMQAQSREEVIPWRVAGEVQCRCHLSGRAASPNAASSSSVTVHDWPEVISDTFDPSNILKRPKLPNRRGHSFPPSATNRPSSPDDGLVSFDGSAPLSPTASLVSRMQAIHGLAKRRPDRPRPSHAAFFRDEPPRALQQQQHRERGPAANRERLRNVRPIDTGQGATYEGYAMSPTSMYSPAAYVDALASSSTSSLASPLGTSQQTLYQMPSPSSDASSNSSKSPLWQQHGVEFDYNLNESVTSAATATMGFGPQQTSSFSPRSQLSGLSTGHVPSTSSASNVNSLSTSSLTDTGLITTNIPTSFGLSSWLGPPPVSYANPSVPYGVPIPSSSSSSATSSAPPTMNTSYTTGSMLPPSVFPSAQLQQQPVSRSAEKARQSTHPFAAANMKNMATTSTVAPTFASASANVSLSSSTRQGPMSNAFAPQMAHSEMTNANANTTGISSGGNRPRAINIPAVGTVSEAARTAGASSSGSASAPALMDGNAPFLFDPVAEAQNTIRMQQAIQTLDSQIQSQGMVYVGRSATSVSPPAVLPNTLPPGPPPQVPEYSTLAYPPRISSYSFGSQTQLPNETMAQGVSYPY